jgi:hypothetical protein
MANKTNTPEDNNDEKKPNKVTGETANQSNEEKKPKKGLPKNKKAIINPPEMSVTLNDLIPPIFSFMAINKGIDPTISITANKVKMTVTNSLKWNSIKKALYEDTKLF